MREKREKLRNVFEAEYLAQIYRYEELNVVGVLQLVFDLTFVYRYHKERAKVFRHRATFCVTDVQKALFDVAIDVNNSVAGIVE